MLAVPLVWCYASETQIYLWTAGRRSEMLSVLFFGLAVAACAGYPVYCIRRETDAFGAVLGVALMTVLTIVGLASLEMYICDHGACQVYPAWIWPAFWFSLAGQCIGWSRGAKKPAKDAAPDA
jgi:hypothetical protein